MPQPTSDEPPDELVDRAQGWVEATIEIPRGSRNKYEFDHERGVFRLDRVLYSGGRFLLELRCALRIAMSLASYEASPQAEPSCLLAGLSSYCHRNKQNGHGIFEGR
jgi:hypothetical protein